jgi:hypothetical protein
MSEQSPLGNNYVAGFLQAAGSGVQLKSLRPKHHAIMDYLIANPSVPYGEVAQLFNVTPAWLSTVINSDLFQAQLYDRRRLMDQALNASITDKLGRLAEKSLDHLEAAIDDEEVSITTKLDVAKTALQAMGFLGPKGGGIGSTPSVQINTSNQTITVLDSAIQQAHQRLQSRGITIDSSPVEPPLLAHKS